MTNSNKDIHNYHNGDFIYQYCKEYVDSVETGLDRINQKLTTVVGFSAVLVKFAGDLNATNQIQLTTKWVAIALLLISTVCCLWGLKSQTTGKTTNPEELFYDYWKEEPENIRAFVIKQWLESIKDLQNRASQRSKLLNIAFVCIGLTTLCFTLNYLT